MAAALLGLLAQACARPPERKAPRLIVLIVVDALRADHLGCYGSPHGHSPNIDDLASRSLVFGQATAGSAWTRSAIATLFTSRYPSAHGVLGYDTRLADSQLTLAEVLAARGWETIAVTTNGNAGHEFGFDQGFESFTFPGFFQGEFRAEGVTSLALQIIDQRLAQLRDKPLFLYLHYIDPHDPYLPNPDLLPGPEPPGRFDGTRAQLDALDLLAPTELTDADQARIQRLYAGEVRYCDRWIGALVNGLGERQLWSETLLALTADHGEGLWTHGQRSHGHSLYQEQIHVPLVLRYPGMDRATARRLDTPVSTVDLAPSLLQAAGIDPPRGFDGHDLRPLIDGPRAEDSQGVFSQLALGKTRMDAVRLGSLKLIQNWTGPQPAPTDAIEIYDVSKDPRETVNLAGRPGTDSQALTDALRTWRQRTRPDHSVGAEGRLDRTQISPQLAEQLRALGYVE